MCAQESHHLEHLLQPRSFSKLFIILQYIVMEGKREIGKSYVVAESAPKQGR
jgi:hypothetical protein